MKRSNLILLIATVTMGLSILLYDVALRDSFRTGRYKVPYSNFITVEMPAFDRANIISSTASNVRFSQGPFSVRVEKAAMDYTKLRVVDGELTIESRFEHHYMFNPEEFIVVVSCPVLRSVHADARYLSGQQPVTDTVYRSDWQMRPVRIDGFHQDSLRLEQDYGSTITLTNNDLNYLSLVSGVSPGSGSRSVLDSGNRIGTARLDVRHRSELRLGGDRISDLSYRLADSAALTITGASQHLFTAAKPWQP